MVNSPLYKKCFQLHENNDQQVNFIIENNDQEINDNIVISDNYSQCVSKETESNYQLDENINKLLSAADDENLDGEEVFLINRNLIAVDNNHMRITAPGQNCQPIPRHLIEDLEKLSFPTIFAGQSFNSTLSYSDRAKSECRRKDRRYCIPTRLLYMAKKNRKSLFGKYKYMFKKVKEHFENNSTERQKKGLC